MINIANILSVDYTKGDWNNLE